MSMGLCRIFCPKGLGDFGLKSGNFQIGSRSLYEVTASVIDGIGSNERGLEDNPAFNVVLNAHAHAHAHA